MRKHLTLKSLSSDASDKKTATADAKPFPNKKSERHDVSPREFVIRNILSYSLALSVFQTQETGFVKMVMN